MKNYDAERVDLDYGYQTTVYYKVHKTIAQFKHTTAFGGYLRTLLAVWWHKLAKQTKAKERLE